MDELEQLKQGLAALEAQRDTLGDAVVDAALGPIRQRLAELEQAEAAPAPTMRGERRQVTVMFADISGFTALAETADPEAVRDLMNACFDRLVPTIKAYGGTVDKFMGDAIMALFGAPIAHENDAERALRAALEMMATLDTFNAERGVDLGLHIGINTGLVIAGVIGTPDRQEYSVMGDAVNLASRLEDVSERGEILVGPHTHRLTAPLFEFEEQPPVRIKGKSEPVPIFRLQATKAIPDKTRGIAGLQSPLVGRQAELRALQKAIEQLRAGHGGIVTIVGEAGLGKSRLVAELRMATLETTPPPQWIEGRCLSYGGSIAYLLWMDLLRALLGVTLEDPPSTVRHRLRKRLQELYPQRLSQVYPFLGRLLSLPLEQEAATVIESLDGEQLKAGTFRAVGTLLECSARQRPLVVVCEDLHWADPTSLELLEQLLPLAEQVSLLLLCLFRPYKDHPCWHIREVAVGLYGPYHMDLWLKPLSATESKRLVGNLLRVEGLPEQLRKRILGRAEGNPFYVEEIIRSLIDGGSIRREEISGRWRAARDVADIAIPDTLQGVLIARIDRLQEETKKILQMAAVIGRIFLYRILATIAHKKGELDEHLTALQREEMIRERTRLPELEYIFKHHLTQEAAYNGLLKRDRRTYHGQVAEALEQTFPDRLEEQVGLLAYHWERAEVADKAIAYLQQAGDYARLAYAHQEAIDYYQRAIHLLKAGQEHMQAARTLMKLGLTYNNAFDFTQARQTYKEGFALWQQAGEIRPAALPPAPHALRTPGPEPLTLDPTLTIESTSIQTIRVLFCGLVEETPDVNIVPSIAQNWEIEEEGRRYTFYLRDDICWTDGTPLTADDFEYAWKRILNPKTQSPAANLLYDIKGARAFHRGEITDPAQVGIRAIDRHTLVLKLEEPVAYFLQMLTYSVFYPIPRHVVELHGEAWAEVETLVGNGPCILESWQRGQKMSFVRNPRYHGRFDGNLERVEVIFTPDRSTRMAMYDADELDVLADLALSAEESYWIRQRHAGEYMSQPQPSTMYIGFHTRRPPFDDPRVRQAFVLAMDRETMVNQTSGGDIFPATGGMIVPGVPGHVPGIAWPYDPQRARQLLAEAGYPGGAGCPVLEFLVPVDTETPGQYQAAQWQEELGVEIRWESMEWGIYLERLHQAPPHIYLLGWIADYPDPDNFLRVGMADAQRHSHWYHDDYERLVERARRVMDHQERMELYRQAEMILRQEVPFFPVGYLRMHIVTKPWVTRFPLSPFRGIFWQDVVIEEH